MSTRSQLRFVQRAEQTSETEGDAERVAQVYRHSDGYPASVLRDLTNLKDLLDATCAERGPAYTAAAFVFLDMLSTVGLYLDGNPERTIDAAQPADLLDPTNMEHLDQPLFLLGHGVEKPADGIHGDEEYLYIVELPHGIRSRNRRGRGVSMSDDRLDRSLSLAGVSLILSTPLRIRMQFISVVSRPGNGRNPPHTMDYEPPNRCGTVPPPATDSGVNRR